MSVETWGLMAKSQEDAETIEEAIDRIVAVHEAEPEAHTGEGESLAAHRENEVVDHLQGSVLADKQTMTETILRSNFQSLDGWVVTGNAVVDGFGALVISIESGDVEDSGILASPQVPLNFLNSAFDMLFQVFGRIQIDDDDFNGVLGFLSTSSTTSTGFGFVVENGVLYGHAKSGTTQNRTSAISVDLTADHVYRVILNAAEQKIYFYIDGEEVGVLDVPATGWETDVSIRLRLTTTGDGIAQMWVSELFVSRSL